MTMGFGLTVTFRRATTKTDRYGNQIPDVWGDVVTVEGVGFAPSQATVLDVQGRDGQQRTPALYGVPADADVRRGDRCDVEDVEWEVEGSPQVWRHPMTGWQPGQVVALKRVDG